MPYAPSRGYDDRVLQLILRRGEDQARGAMESGAIWGNTVAGLGQQVGGAIQQYGQQKEIAKRDSAWLQYVQSGEWQKDPKAAYTAAKTIWGPDGDKQFQSLMGVAQLMGEKRDPAADSKSLGALIDGMDRMTDGGRAAAYPQAAALAKRVYPELQLSPEYDPKQWAEISPLGKALRGEKAPEGFTLGQGQTRFGPDGQPIAAVAEPPKPEPAFTLGAGEVRYGPDGKPIASRPPKPDAPSKERLWVIRDGKPIRVSEAEYRPGDLPANTREQGRPVTSGDSTTVAELDSSLDDLNTLASTLSGNKATGTRAKAGALLWNPITELTGWGSDAKAKQATIDGVKQVIGKALEGGVLRKEDEYKYEKILPTIGDVPGVVDAKLKGLWERIQQKRQTFLESKADAGYDVTKYSARPERQRVPRAETAPQGGEPPIVSSPEEARKLPPGTLFRTPDGRTKRR